MYSHRIDYRILDSEGTLNDYSDITISARPYYDMDIIIFAVALNTYNTSEQDPQGMKESMRRFSSLINSTYLKSSTPIILMMTKLDIFLHQIAGDSLANYWPDFPTLEKNPHDGRDGLQFLTSQFATLKKNLTRAIHVCYIDTLDTETFGLTLQGVQNVLSDNVLNRTGSNARTWHLANRLAIQAKFGEAYANQLASADKGQSQQGISAPFMAKNSLGWN